MAFVSVQFLIFIAVTILVYFLVPKKFQWCVLLAASYAYFWFSSKWLFLVLLASTAVTFFTAKAVYGVNTKGKQYIKDNTESMSSKERKEYKDKTKKKAKRVLMVGVILDLGTLLFLKYFNFFASNSNRLLKYAGIELPMLQLLLPIGISFYTLQAIAYMVDVYRGKYEPDKHFGKFMLFMSYFPQIVQGPIARHNQLAHQLYEEHKFDYKRFMYGLQLILWGYMKKMIIADRIAIPVNQIFDHYSDYSGLMIFFGAAFYGLQVYADFFGGMDIARGFSQIIGVELELNFLQPYFSKSIEDFWRRWHITLGGWMRDYVFYPLSLSKAFGNLSKKSRKVLGQFVGKRLPSFLAMFIVYFLVGFWHGANWKYIAYGVWNGVFITAGILLVEVYDKAREKCGIAADSFTWRLFQIIRTFCLVAMGRIFSRADDLGAALGMFKLMFKKFYDLSFILDGSLINLGLDNANWILLIISVVVLFVVDYLHERGVQIRDKIANQNIIFRWLIYYAAIIIIIIFGVYGPEYNSASFIYEKF